MNRLMILTGTIFMLSIHSGNAKTIKVPKEINGQKVYFVMWQKKHSSGSVSTRVDRARFRLKTKVPFPYQNSKTCFLNSKQKVITCRK